jgi:hypothetical protein
MLIMTEPMRELGMVGILVSQFGRIVPLPFKLASNNVKIALSLRSILILNNSC